MTRFSGGFDGAAGPIRSVTACTCDLLPMIARAGELLHPGLDLTERAARLLARLDLGILGAAVDIWRHAGRDLGRADYRRLGAARCGKQRPPEARCLMRCGSAPAC